MLYLNCLSCKLIKIFSKINYHINLPCCKNFIITETLFHCYNYGCNVQESILKNSVPTYLWFRLRPQHKAYNMVQSKLSDSLPIADVITKTDCNTRDIVFFHCIGYNTAGNSNNPGFHGARIRRTIQYQTVQVQSIRVN